MAALPVATQELLAAASVLGLHSAASMIVSLAQLSDLDPLA